MSSTGLAIYAYKRTLHVKHAGHFTLFIFFVFCVPCSFTIPPIQSMRIKSVKIIKFSISLSNQNHLLTKINLRKTKVLNLE